MRLKHFISVFLALLTLSVGQMWGASFTGSNFSGQGVSGGGSNSAISATVEGVTFECTNGYGASSTVFRCYKSSTVTISSNSTITAISFTFDGSYTGGLNTSYENLSTNSWEVTLGSQARISNCTVTVSSGNPGSPTVSIAPTATDFLNSVEVTLTPSEGATAYYTLNGTDPSSASTQYTAPFTLTETKTVKAIAIKGAASSSIAEKTFTKVTPKTTADGLREAELTTSDKDVWVNLQNWKVTHVSGNYVYLIDQTNEGVVLNQSGHGYTAGDVLSDATVSVKARLNAGRVQLSGFTSSTISATTGSVTIDDITDFSTLEADHQSRLVTLKDAIYHSSGKTFTDENNHVIYYYNQFSLNPEPALVDGAKYDVTGVVIWYKSGNAAGKVELAPRAAEDVVEKEEVTIPTVASLAELKEAAKSTYIVTLTNAVVTYVSGKNAFIEEGDAGALIYMTNHGFEAGDQLDGDYLVSTDEFNGKFEITAIEAQDGAITTKNAEIPVTTLTIAQLNANFAAFESRRVKIENVTVTDAVEAGDATARTGEMSDGENTITLYGNNSVVADEDAELSSVIGYPGFFNENHQFTLWAQDDITVLEKVNVRFMAPAAWGENVYIHTWNDVENGTHLMTATGEDRWFSYDVKKGAGCLFYQGNWDWGQTVNASEALNEDACFIWTNSYDGENHMNLLNTCDFSYYIAGSQVLTGANWQHIALVNNTVTYNNVAAGNHEFKISNGTWDWSLGRTYASATGVTLWDSGDNVGFTTTKVMNITISYNPATETISVNAEEVASESWSTVQFMSAGNVFTSKVVPQGAEYTIDLTTNPTRPGYTFAGWSADEIAEANAFTPLTSFTPDEENETLYAVFAKQTSPATTSFNKVTATDDIEDGEYLIVYEGDNTHDAAVFDGSLDNDNIDLAKVVLPVEIENNTIAVSEELLAATFTINTTAGTLQASSGLYIGREDYANGLDKNTETAYTNTFAISEGKAVITGAGNCTLRYNYASDQLRFRYYKSGQQPVQLYKKVVTPGTSVYTTSPAAVYHIAGDEALTGADWQHIALGEGNAVTYKNLPALTEGGYKFKITDGTWDFNKGNDAVDKDNSTGVTFDDNDADGNVVFMLAAESNVTITYDATNAKILVNAEPVIVPITYHIAGDEGLTGESWQHIALGEGNSITFNNVEAGTWEFKLTDGNSNWYGYGVIGVGEGSIDLADAGEPNHNIQFTLAAKSNVTITYDVDNNKVTVTAEAVIVPVSSNVVILAEYNSKFYAMTNSLDNGALAGVEVEKDGAKIVVTSEENKAAIQWTRTVTGDNTTLKDGNDKFIKGSNGASLSLNETYNWNWDGEKSCYISSAYPTRGLFFSNSGVFKGYALSNLETTSYAPIEVIEIAAEDIVVDVPVTHILSYNPNGGTLIGGETAIANADVAEGATVTVAANVYEKDGYMFTGWLYGETVYNAGQTFPMPTENVELVAQWSEVVVSDYVLVTDVAQLQAGDKVIIVAADYNVAAGSAASTYRSVVDIEKTSDKSHLIFGASMPTEFTLGIPADGEYSFNDGDGFMYESAAKSVKVQDESFSWSISIDADAIATISASNALKYNSTSPRFTTYASGQSALQLYRKPGVTPPTPTDEYIEIRTGLTAGNYYTVCYPKAMSAIKGATLWSFAGADANMAYLVQEDAPFVAGRPYIIYAESDKLEAIVEGDEEAAGNYNGLYGTLADLNNDALVATGATHILKANELRQIGNGHLDAQRAYIIASEIPGGEPQPAPGKKVRSMPMRQDAATGMDEINASETPVKMIIDGQLYILRGDKMYNANGQLVK